MKLTELSIKNFRAITSLKIDNLADAVVLAGPNGCGKSCVLDAIRLLKSAYGSYEQDEVQTWFGEFQIDLNREPRELLTLFQDTKTELQISGKFVLSEEEQTFLMENAQNLLEEAAWRQQVHPNTGPQSAGALALAANQRTNHERVETYVTKTLPVLQKALTAAAHEAILII
jgi:predicted ATPase